MNSFVLTSFGDRVANVHRSLDNIREFFKEDDYRIYVLTDSDVVESFICRKPYENVSIFKVPLIFPEHKRWGHRSGDYWPIKFVLERFFKEDDIYCCLDDDMFIVNPHFRQGFDIAKKFGVAAPLNPRLYAWYDIDGEDCNRRYVPKDLPDLLTVTNFSPLFIRRNQLIDSMFTKYCLDMLTVPIRGPMALARAFWEFGFTPHILPETWCVCGENAEYWKNYKVHHQNAQVAICLHIGHKEVRQVYGV